MLDHILFKTNADTSAALTAMTTNPSSRNQIQSIEGQFPALIGATYMVCHTALVRARAQLYKTDEETQKVLDLYQPHAFPGYAAGENVPRPDPVQEQKMSLKFDKSLYLTAKVNCEQASVDQGLLLQILYGQWNQYEGKDIFIYKRASQDAAVDTWKEIGTISASDGLTPGKQYALAGFGAVPDDSAGDMAVKFLKAGWPTQPCAPIIGGTFSFRDHMLLDGGDTLTMQMYGGVTNKQPYTWTWLKEIGA